MGSNSGPQSSDQEHREKEPLQCQEAVGNPVRRPGQSTRCAESRPRRQVRPPPEQKLRLCPKLRAVRCPRGQCKGRVRPISPQSLTVMRPLEIDPPSNCRQPAARVAFRACRAEGASGGRQLRSSCYAEPPRVQKASVPSESAV